MCRLNRRSMILGSTAAAIVPTLLSSVARANVRHFLAEAERMKSQAIAAGDQPYGAVLVLDAKIVGYGPSRVITSGNVNAHAEPANMNWHAPTSPA